MDSTQITLPKLLSENGYVSGMVGKWKLGSRGFMKSFLNANDNPKDSATNEKLKTYQNELRKKIWLMKDLVLGTLKQKPADLRWYKNDWGEIIWHPKHKFLKKYALYMAKIFEG